MIKITTNYGRLKKSTIIMILFLSAFIISCNPEKDKNFKNNGLNTVKSEILPNEQIEKIEILEGEKLATLKEVVNATDMEIHGEELYVLDEVVVYVYSLKDFRLLRKFGRKGNGPGEMVYHRATTVQMELFKDSVYLYRMNKLVTFSKKGKLERQKIFRFFITQVIPLEKGFVIVKLRLANQYVAGKEKFGTLTLLLFDTEFKKSREIYQKKFPAEDLEKDGHEIFRTRRNLIVRHSENQLFLFDTQLGSPLLTFDAEGRPTKQVVLNLPKIPIPKKFKKDALNWMKSDPYLKVFTEEWNLEILFPQQFPLLRNFTVKNNRIYCQTYIKKNSLSKFFILNLKGECLKKIFLPSAEREMIRFGTNKIYDFVNNKYYYLKDNEKDETWELFCVDIKSSEKLVN